MIIKINDEEQEDSHIIEDFFVGLVAICLFPFTIVLLIGSIIRKLRG